MYVCTRTLFTIYIYENKIIMDLNENMTKDDVDDMVRFGMYI